MRTWIFESVYEVTSANVIYESLSPQNVALMNKRSNYKNQFNSKIPVFDNSVHSKKDENQGIYPPLLRFNFRLRNFLFLFYTFIHFTKTEHQIVAPDTLLSYFHTK
jgi:hypothetical protein